MCGLLILAISLSITFSRSIRGIAYISTPFLFLAKIIFHILFIHPSDGHVGCFPLWATVA